MAKANVLIGSGGWYVEWYRDDDGDSGYGDNPQRAYWYGTREECYSLAQAKPPKGTPWVRIK